jgi:hypothetical protein
MFTEENLAVANALATGLSIARKEMPIRYIDVTLQNGARIRWCQYPESFCEFIEVDGEWDYHRCSCAIDTPQEQINFWETSERFYFPDFYDRDIYFCIHDGQTALFVDGVFQGLLGETEACECLHHHTPGGFEPRPTPPVPDTCPPPEDLPPGKPDGLPPATL